MSDSNSERERGPLGPPGAIPDTATSSAALEPNRDPITGEPGAHPVGTGVGAATGGTVGAVIGGAVGGPLGAMVGAAVGGIAGGLAGKGISESVNPTEEDAFWRDNYSTRPYASNLRYEDLQPAYRYGWEARCRHESGNWNDIEDHLERDWTQRHGSTGLSWNKARHAARDAWDRVEARHRHLTSSAGTGSARGGLSRWEDEDNYWRNNYSSRPYSSGRSYDDLGPAYRYGYESASQYRGRSWNEAESDLERGWERAKGTSRSAWQEVKDAVRDAWHRVERAMPGDADRDGR